MLKITMTFGVSDKHNWQLNQLSIKGIEEMLSTSLIIFPFDDTRAININQCSPLEIKVEENEFESCKTCLGRGFQIGGGDSVDYGSTTVSLPTYPEPCEDCTGHGLCPSCGWTIIHESEGDENFEAWWDNPTTCPNPECGWEPTEIKNF